MSRLVSVVITAALLVALPNDEAWLAGSGRVVDSDLSAHTEGALADFRSNWAVAILDSATAAKPGKMVAGASSRGALVMALRLYGPLEPWFDKTWRPGEFELQN